MDKKSFLVGLFLIASTTVVSANSVENETRCKAWAQEENISQDEMAQYMEECVASLAIDGEEKSQSDSSSSGDNR